MKTILAIINDPENSGYFVQYAALLAKDLEMNVHLLYVEDPDYYITATLGATGTESVQMQRNLQQVTENATRILEQRIKDVINEIPAQTTINYSSEIGITRLIIEQYLADRGISLVLLESHQNENFWTPDSSSTEIIRHTDCPVWIVPYKANYEPIKVIVYATDYNEEDIPTLTTIIEMTGRHSPEITMLHITDTDDFKDKIEQTGFIEMIKSKSEYDKISVKSIINEKKDNISEIVNDYASIVHANLVVLLKENRNFIERIFNPDSTKKIIKKLQTPVLVFHKIK